MGRTSQITNKLIIDLSLELIDKNGPIGLNVKDLAKKLKIQPPSLYNHIENINHLNQLIFLSISDELVNFLILETTKNKNKSKNRLLGLALAYRKFVHTYPSRYQFIAAFPFAERVSMPTSSLVLRDYLVDFISQVYNLKNSDQLFAA